MQALTLRHPWPWAIVALGKRIENRKWSAAMAPGTWYAIHGGKVPTGDDLYDVLEQARELVLRLRYMLPRDANPKLRDACLTGIVALAQHGGYVRESDDPWFEGPVGWVIADLIVLDEPIPCRGAQGLWNVPEEIAAILNAVVKGKT